MSAYIVLMLFTVDKQKDFPLNAYVKRLDTRNKNHLYLPILILSCVQKGVPYPRVKLFNSFQVIYRVIEITEKDSEASYSDT
jgi:hypothetical protein